MYALSLIMGHLNKDPHDFLQKHGCPKCKNEATSERCRYTTEIFIKKAKKIHGNFYDYSKVNYVTEQIPVEIICPIHRSFWQQPNGHLMNEDCPKCENEKNASRNRKSWQLVLSQMQKKHKEKYTYPNIHSYINTNTPIEICCKTHGIFLQTPESHLAGQGCPRCRESKGERAIANFLEEHGLTFKTQVKFSDCKRKRCLPFDFAVYDTKGNISALIEFQGEQHYRSVKHFGGNKKYIRRLESDRIKQEYCQSHNFFLLTIPYTKMPVLDIVLSQYLS
ncbi:Uncharacterised protein [uncultured archaeon]|nr:Uncharacterised protein [uncultured archaeon]